MISLTLGTTLEGCLVQLPIEAHQNLAIVAISGVSQGYAAGRKSVGGPREVRGSNRRFFQSSNLRMATSGSGKPSPQTRALLANHLGHSLRVC